MTPSEPGRTASRGLFARIRRWFAQRAERRQRLRQACVVTLESEAHLRGRLGELERS